MPVNPEEQLPARYPWLMVLHVLFMSGAFFVALPAGESSESSGLSLPRYAVPNTPVLSQATRGFRISHTHTRSDFLPRF